MEPRITVLTLGVRDLQTSLAFCRDGLGLPTPGIVGSEFEYGAVVFIELQGGLHLALWPTPSLSRDTGIALQETGVPRISIGHNVRSKDEVDALMRQARQAGAAIVKPPAETFWGGYAGYFQDPDGYLWEVAWNPQMLPGA